MDVATPLHGSSRSEADLAWLHHDRIAHVVFSHNLHEVRAYNRLARMARAPLLAFVQDDKAPPEGCDYLNQLRQMMHDDPKLALVGGNVHTHTVGPSWTGQPTRGHRHRAAAQAHELLLSLVEASHHECHGAVSC